MDFLIYYTDWSNLCAPFEGYGAVRSHNLSRRDQPPAELSSYVKEFVAKLQRGEPSVQHVALAFDGILVAAVIESEIVGAIIGAVFLIIYPIPTGP
jgi:hypothetical protein